MSNTNTTHHTSSEQESQLLKLHHSRHTTDKTCGVNTYKPPTGIPTIKHITPQPSTPIKHAGSDCPGTSENINNRM